MSELQRCPTCGAPVTVTTSMTPTVVEGPEGVLRPGPKREHRSYTPLGLDAAERRVLEAAVEIEMIHLELPSVARRKTPVRAARLAYARDRLAAAVGVVIGLRAVAAEAAKR